MLLMVLAAFFLIFDAISGAFSVACWSALAGVATLPPVARILYRVHMPRQCGPESFGFPGSCKVLAMPSRKPSPPPSPPLSLTFC